MGGVAAINEEICNTYAAIVLFARTSGCHEADARAQTLFA